MIKYFRNLNIDKFIRERYFIDFTKLTSAAGFGQLLTIILSPLITRIYEPIQFSQLAIFLTLVTIFNPLFSGKYEFGLINAKKKIECNSLLVLSIQLIALSTIILWILLLILPSEIKELLKLNSLGILQYLVPLATACQAIFNCIKYWLFRYQNFSKLSISILINSISKALLSISLGILILRSNGLIIASIFSVFLTCIFLINFVKFDIKFNEFFQFKNTFANAKKYRKYPLFNALPSLLDNLIFEMPVFLIAIFYTESNLADYAIISRVFSLPLAYCTSSFSNIILSYSSKKIRENKHVYEDIKKILIFVSIFMGSITLIMMVFSPTLIPTIFGEKWRETSLFFRILLPSIFIRELASSLSTTIVSNNRSELLGIWQLTAFVFTSITLFYFARILNFTGIIFVISILNTILYSFYIAITLYAAKKPKFL